jgi:hypothetical protein
MGAIDMGGFIVSDASHRDMSSPSLTEFSGDVLGDLRSPVPIEKSAKAPTESTL